MKIAVIGSGAIGSYYGAKLAAAGHDVRFLMRSDFAHVKAHGLEIRSIHGNFTLSEVQAYESTEEMGIVDLVIVAWKTTSNDFLKEVVSPLVGEQTKILTLQNGLGNVESLGALFGIERVLGGLCFVCINRLSSGVISHTASGLIRLAWASGSADGYLESLREAFKAAGIRCDVMDNLEKALWMKLMWNFSFNGLAIAEGGVDTEVLLQERKLEPLVREIMQEVIQVGAALGHTISERVIDQQIEITYPMGPYKPSSMIDFMEGRAVEYEAIWQKPLEVAAGLGVEVPRMKELAGRIKLVLDEGAG